VQAATVADLTLEVRDASAEPQAEVGITTQTIDNKRLIVNNKSDSHPPAASDAGLFVSATTGAGIDRLRTRIVEALDVDLLRDSPAITNIRHVTLVERAHAALQRARVAVLAAGATMSEEFVLADLQDARAALEEITGRRAPEDVLEHIFSRFCIGK
jgi:tRNA modification GTPase